MKFKRGDKAIIKRDLNPIIANKLYGMVDSMMEMEGKEVTISRVRGDRDGKVKYEIGEDCYVRCEECFEDMEFKFIT